MARVAFNCADVEGDTCPVKIFGEREDVVKAAQDHLVATHGMTQGGDTEQKVNGAIDASPTKDTLWGN